MKNTNIVVTIVTLYAIIFSVSPYVGVSDLVYFAMLFLSPILVVFMVFFVLKYGKPSEFSFDEKFYDDLD